MIDSQSYVGNDCMIKESAEITNSTLADEVQVDQGTKVNFSDLGKKVMLGRNNSILYSKVDKYCYTGFNTTIVNAKVGKFNSISWNVSIGGNTHDLNHVTTHSFLVYEKWGMGANGNWKSASRECIIENDVWIGAGASILRGVTIHDGAVIGASAVVTKDVPPYAIVVGNPAKILKMRVAPEVAERLLELKWWDFPEAVIRSNLELFQADLTMEVIDSLFQIKESLH